MSNFFKRLFKKQSPKSLPITLTSYSQPHVLQQRMKETNLTHGERVKADIGPIRIVYWTNGFAMHFCPMQTISIKERMETGDGGALPGYAVIENLKFPSALKEGLYMIKNAEIFSNGTLQVIAREDTKFEMI